MSSAPQPQPQHHGFGFASIGHFFASVAHDIVKVGRAVAGIAPKIAGNEPMIAGLTALVAPQFVPLERGAFAIFGLAAQAVMAAGYAAAANGINLQLDAQVVADIRALIPAIQEYAKSQGIQPPPK